MESWLEQIDYEVLQFKSSEVDTIGITGTTVCPEYGNIHNSGFQYKSDRCGNV